MGEVKNVFKNLVAKPEKRRPLERYSSIWEDNIKASLKNWDLASILN
jgi:hypothetical protein